jgi:hypothetical protein
MAVFSHQLPHHLVGVKVHGKGVTFYPFVDTVQKAANLVLYVLFNELQKFYDEYKYWPTELYAQIDGGAEFANKILLGGFEWLVIKRMTRVMYYTRLPTGHTHEDIDGKGYIFNIIITLFYKRFYKQFYFMLY